MSRIASEVCLTRIGDYEILNKIGHGGMGAVYKGLDPQTGQVVAIKVIRGEVAADPVLRLRFAQECQVTRKLVHPHIVRVLDFGLAGSTPFLVMEYVDGESLGERLEREGRLPEAEAVRLITQVGQALHWAHERRLIHRDVKPDNILLGPDGQAKLTDLGLVKNLEGDFNLTQTLSSLGTPHFMAPEQFEDAKRVDALSDLYSLAATLYMSVTGELPFQVRHKHAVTAIYKKKLVGELASPRQLVPQLSERTEQAILQALRVDRNERQPSVLAFLQSLTDEPLAFSTEVPATAQKPAEDPASLLEKERRIKRRFPTKQSISCKPFQRAADKSWGSEVVNISETGLCVEASRRFEPGTLLTILLEAKEPTRRSLVVRVRWVKKLSPKTWQMGCQFDRPLCDFEVHELR
jgi:serine/threonine protein kinase